jgi:arylsulfatase A-like enzyme
VPSRSAFHTSRYPHVNRTPGNLYRLPDGERTLAAVLNENGYLTATTGELPFAPTSALGGFREILGRGYQKPAPHDAAQAPFQALAAPWNDEEDETAYWARSAIEFLKAKRQQSFYLHVNFRRPHHPFDPPAPFDRMYDGATFPRPAARPGEMDNKPPGQRKSLESTAGVDLRRMTGKDLDKIRSYYYGMISLQDKYIGRILATLAETGLAANTAVIFTADHGEMLGDHGLLFKGGYFYEGVVHAPLMIRAPWRIAAGRRVQRLVEAIDVLPTALELLGLPLPAGLQGRSLLGDNPGKPAVFSEFANIKMARTAEWKLVHYLRAPYGELYNLKDDPQELDNLWDDPGAARARRTMQALLADWLIDSADPLYPPVKA